MMLLYRTPSLSQDEHAAILMGRLGKALKRFGGTEKAGPFCDVVGPMVPKKGGGNHRKVHWKSRDIMGISWEYHGNIMGM
jgi:hypothetical protein